MKHFASPDFWALYEELPLKAKKSANKQFKLLKENPTHPSLYIKKIGKYWAARVDLNHRALAVHAGESLVWFWIGNHRDYEKLIRVKQG